jgi:hypothetical protein
MTRSRRGWFDLPPDERRAVLVMVWLVPALHVAVRVWDYRRTRAWLEANALRRSRHLRQPEGRMDAYRLATSRVTRYSWLPGNCLSRSLALLWALRRNGYAAELCLGVSLAGGEFAAHAWVTLAGRVLNDTQDVASRYVPFSNATPSQHAFD